MAKKNAGWNLLTGAYPNLIYYNKVDKDGHFAAWEVPGLFAKELRKAFRSLLKCTSNDTFFRVAVHHCSTNKIMWLIHGNFS